MTPVQAVSKPRHRQLEVLWDVQTVIFYLELSQQRYSPRIAVSMVLSWTHSPGSRVLGFTI